jgi:hypothetical protein
LLTFQTYNIYIVSKVEGHLLKKSTRTICSKDDLLADETWLAILEPELCKDSAAVECLVRLLFILRREINSGSAGVKRASKILSNGIDVMYLYTDAHRAALELYVLSLAGELKPQDEPLNLLKAAIARGKGQAR